MTEPVDDIPTEAAQGQGPVWFAQEAIRVVRLDTEAIVRVARAPSALAYGTVITFVAVVVRILATEVATPNVVTLLVAALIGLVTSAVSTAVMHGAAKVLFGATGTYIGVLRVLWLSSIVGCLAAIPWVGPIVAGLWSLLIMMVTFQEVDGIERIQALGLSLGLSACLFFLSLLVS